jgi:hypothetical protein
MKALSAGRPNPSARRSASAIVLVALALLASACSRHLQEDLPPLPSASNHTPSPIVSGSQTGSTLPLGTLTLTSGSPSCAQGGSCRLGFQVECPDVQQRADGTLIATGPGSQPRGLVMGFVGTLGTGTLGLSKQWVDDMVAAGFEVVVVSWADQTPWLQSAQGEQAGPKLLACRPATTIKWVHDNIFEQLGSPSTAEGVCGFCATGNSGGASQIAYALSFYDVAKLLDAAVLTSGPPHTALDKACLGPSPDLRFDPDSASIVDLSYGFARGTGPCVEQDQSFADTWLKDSVDEGGTYSFPHTRVAFLFVQGDHTAAPFHGKLYLQKLQAAGGPMVTDRTIPGTSHTIMTFPEGRQAVEDELLSGT